MIAHARPWLTLVVLACCGRLAAGDVPPPEQTPARVIVSGRTSTVGEVKVVAVGVGDGGRSLDLGI